MGVSGQFQWIKAKFDDLDGAKAAGLKIRDRFEKVIQDTKGAFVVAVAMDMKAFKDLNSKLDVRRNQNWESDYMVSTYQMTIGLTLETVRQLENEGTQRFIVSFVCDDGPQKKKLEQGYDAFKLRFPEWVPYMGGISHLNDKKVAGLQAADLMAAYTRELSKDWIADPTRVINPVVVNEIGRAHV